MKTIVMYRSVTGFTKKYAEWIAEALSANLYEAARVNPGMLFDYDCIIYGGRLYAVGIDGLSRFKKHLVRLEGKQLIVFATGASPVSKAVSSEVKTNNFSEAEQAQVECFYLRGGFNYAGLPLVDKLLMFLLKLKIKSKVKEAKS